jgi:hypothetical protein
MKPMSARDLLDATDLDLNAGASLLSVLAAWLDTDAAERAELLAVFGHIVARYEDPEEAEALRDELAATVRAPRPWPLSNDMLGWLKAIAVLDGATRSAEAQGFLALYSVLVAVLAESHDNLRARPDLALASQTAMLQFTTGSDKLPWQVVRSQSGLLADLVRDPLACKAILEHWAAGQLDSTQAQALTRKVAEDADFRAAYRANLMPERPVRYAKTAIVDHRHLVRVWPLPHLGPGQVARLVATNAGLHLDVAGQFAQDVVDETTVVWPDPQLGPWSLPVRVSEADVAAELDDLASALQTQRAAHRFDRAQCESAVAALADASVIGLVERLAKIQVEAEDLDGEQDERAMDLLHTMLTIRLALQAYLLTTAEAADLRQRASLADRGLRDAGIGDALGLVPADGAWWLDDPLCTTIGWLRESAALVSRALEIPNALLGSKHLPPPTTKPVNLAPTLAEVRLAIAKAIGGTPARIQGPKKVSLKRAVVAAAMLELVDKPVWQGPEENCAVLERQAGDLWQVTIYSSLPVEAAWLFECEVQGLARVGSVVAGEQEYRGTLASAMVPDEIDVDTTPLVLLHGVSLAVWQHRLAAK